MELDNLLCQFEGRSRNLLFGLEGREIFADRMSALTVDSRVTCGPRGETDAATVDCVIVCCYTVSVYSYVVAIPVLRLHG